MAARRELAVLDARFRLGDWDAISMAPEATCGTSLRCWRRVGETKCFSILVPEGLWSRAKRARSGLSSATGNTSQTRGGALYLSTGLTPAPLRPARSATVIRARSVATLLQVARVWVALLALVQS